MIAILVLVLVAAILVYLAATFLPPPINWIVALVILVLAVVAVFGGVADAAQAAKFWGGAA